MLITTAQQQAILFRIAAFFLTILATILVVRLVLFFMDRASRNRFSTVTYRAQSFVPQVLYFLGFVIAIAQLGLSVSLMAVIIGIMGVGFLVGSRTALENMFSKYYVDLFSPYRLGDKVVVEEHEGEIIEINVLNTVLLDKKERLVIIPNTQLLSSTVINRSKGARHELHLPIVVSRKVDVMEFERRVLRMCEGFKNDLLKHPKPIVVTTRSTPGAEEVTLIASIRSPEKRPVVTERLKHKIEEILEEMIAEKETFVPKEV